MENLISLLLLLCASSSCFTMEINYENEEHTAALQLMTLAYDSSYNPQEWETEEDQNTLFSDNEEQDDPSYPDQKPRKRAKKNKDKPAFICSENGCRYKNQNKRNFQKHLDTHTKTQNTGQEPYTCTYESCFYITFHHGNFKKHLEGHNPVKKYKCPVKGCIYQTRHKRSITTHQKNKKCPKQPK